ncbi:MAG: hypothetical protein RSA20_04985, partial [Oscillospiraceae bacterium]
NYNFISAVLSALTNALDAISKGQSPKIAMDISIYTLCNTVVAPVVQLAAGQSPVKNQSKAVSTPSTKEEIVPFESWKDVIEKIEETDRPFSSFMKGSKAYLYDGIVYIDGNEGFNSYIRTNKEAGAIVKKAIAEVCGRTYNIGGYKNISSKFEEKKTDELDDILALRKSGVEVTIED